MHFKSCYWVSALLNRRARALCDIQPWLTPCRLQTRSGQFLLDPRGILPLTFTPPLVEVQGSTRGRRVLARGRGEDRGRCGVDCAAQGETVRKAAGDTVASLLTSSWSARQPVSRVQQGGDVSKAVFSRAARREHAWPSGRLGRGGAIIAQPPRRDALVLKGG